MSDEPDATPPQNLFTFHIWNGNQSGFSLGRLFRAQVELSESQAKLLREDYVGGWGRIAAKSYLLCQNLRIRCSWIQKPLARFMCLTNAAEFFASVGLGSEYDLLRSWPIEKMEAAIEATIDDNYTVAPFTIKFIHTAPADDLLASFLEHPDIVNLRNRHVPDGPHPAVATLPESAAPSSSMRRARVVEETIPNEEDGERYELIYQMRLGYS